jgi:6-phosphogluconolactonase
MKRLSGLTGACLSTALLSACAGGGNGISPSPTFKIASGSQTRRIASVRPNRNREFVYVANQGADTVSAYTVDPSGGGLSPVSGSPFAAGIQPSGIAVDPSNKFAYVANQNYPNPKGTVSAYTIDRTTGALEAVKRSPYVEGRNPYLIAVDPTGKFVYITNIFSDDVSAYTINKPNGSLTRIAGSPFETGGNPEGITTDPVASFVYIADTLTGEISGYTIEASSGALSPIAGSPFASGRTPDNLAIDPAGKFMYASNGRAANIWAYTIDSSSGALAPVTGSPFRIGAVAGAGAVDPMGRFVYFPIANGVAVFAIDPSSGSLKRVKGSPFKAGSGNHLAINPSGKFLYVANATTNDVSGFTVNATNGALTPVAGSPFAAGTTPLDIAIASP